MAQLCHHEAARTPSCADKTRYAGEFGDTAAGSFVRCRIHPVRARGWPWTYAQGSVAGPLPRAAKLGGPSGVPREGDVGDPTGPGPAGDLRAFPAAEVDL